VPVEPSPKSQTHVFGSFVERSVNRMNLSTPVTVLSALKSTRGPMPTWMRPACTFVSCPKLFFAVKETV
jgi:hypothetical protein